MRKLLLFSALVLLPFNAFAASTDTVFDTDTKLMLHANGTDASTSFPDDSASTHTVTANANAQIDTAQSKFGGASGLFDGTGDNIKMPASTDWDVGTGDFTIDFWVRYNSVGAENRHFDFGNFSAGKGLVMGYSGGTVTLYFNGNAGASATFSWSASTATWYHLAFTRSSGGVRFFVDGTQTGTTQTKTDNVASGGNTPTIGHWTSITNFALNGWIDEFRFVKGTAVWTANFTPPTAEYIEPSGFTPKITWFN